ncbi:MAG: hypothetical protein EIB84_00165 (plasmid) [Spiroplasma poulsonii]|nr:hypothetical protein [Spiroplasma poulsonii]
MKKILSILGTVSLTATGASSVVACKKLKEKEKENIEENNNDIKTWNKIQQETANMFLNELKKEDMVYQINDSTLYSEVSNTNQSKNIDLTGIESNIITQIIKNKLDNINNKIKNEHNNFYYNSEPIKIIQKTFTINYIDPKAYSIINNINVRSTTVKAITITCNFQFELTFKNIINNFDHKFDFIFTTNKNFILDKISELINYIIPKIDEFYANENNYKIKLEDIDININPELKRNIAMLDINNNSKLVNNYNKNKIQTFLESMAKNDKKNIDIEIDNNFLISKNNNNEDIFNIWRDFTAKNQKVSTEKDILEENSLSKWLFNKNNLKNNGDDFVNFYYKNTIENELKINSFYINLNAISIFGLPLINKILKKEINLYMTKQWFKNEIKSFGNLIYNFFKYFETKLNDDKTITLKVESEIYNKLDNKSRINQRHFFESLITNFIKNNKMLNNIDMFNLYFMADDLIPIKEENNKKHFDNTLSTATWNIKFVYGVKWQLDKLYYISLASTNDISSFYIEKK